MKSEESDDYINFTDFITLNLIGIRVPLYACVCVCVYVDMDCRSEGYLASYCYEIRKGVRPSEKIVLKWFKEVTLKGRNKDLNVRLSWKWRPSLF